MYTVRLNKNGDPIELLGSVPNNNIVSIPALESIMDEVNNNTDLVCAYGDLIEDDMETIKELLNSEKRCLVDLGKTLLGMVVNDYNIIMSTDNELPIHAEKIIEYILTQPEKES